MCFGGNKTAAAPPPPPPTPVAAPPAAPTIIDPAVKVARKNEKMAAAKLKGRTGTILTASRGVLTDANTTKNTLLGS
tara:strand:- start:211 stop:441 length:231 start_codon:yes stop_codon:yes gene_type:complete